jgi:DNA-directed RNA polymerase subunit L
MKKIEKIDFKILNQNNVIGDSRLEFNICGSDINYVIVNTLRREIMTSIPIYAFDDIKFEKINSIFHSNMLNLRLTNLPVWGIINTVDYIDYNLKSINVSNNNFDINEDINDDIDLNIADVYNLSSLKQLTMYVNYKNKTNDIVTVTTDDAKFYYDEKQIESPYLNKNLQIVKLKPDQEIAFSAITRVGTEFEHTMFSAISIATYEQKTNTNFNFILESRGQITEKRILIVSIINIIKRLDNFIKCLNDVTTKLLLIENTSDNLDGKIIINNEDHTLGNLISRGLQQHNQINSAGYNLEHPLVRKVIFSYSMKSNNNIKKICEDVVNYYLDLFARIRKHIETI